MPAALPLEEVANLDLDAAAEGVVPAFLRSLLVRAHFVPAVRHALGWRGLSVAPGAAEAWTAKIAAAAGVFGVFFQEVENAPGGWIAGRFGLCYFPDPEEERVEAFSVRAAAETQRPGYRERVRRFTAEEGFADLFGVALIRLGLRRDRGAASLALEAPERLRVLAPEGIRLAAGGEERWLVAPGGVDEDFPAWETALPFFETLAASLVFHLGRPPDRLRESQHPACEIVASAAGGEPFRPAADLRTRLLRLDFGDFGAEAPFESPALGEPEPVSAKFEAEGPEGTPAEYRERLWWRAHGLKPGKCIEKRMLGVDERPPFILLTGFLGAGKTSFLRHFLEYQSRRHRFVAVIQNEIGEVGLDGKLLDYEVTEIDEGCVCCTLAGNLKRALQEIRARFSPDCVILETSGLANPLHLLEEEPDWGELVRYDCTVTLVDAANASRLLSGEPLAVDQVRAADILVMNKRDLVDEARLAEVDRLLAGINPRALRFPAVRGDLNPAWILDFEPAGPRGGAGKRPPRAGLTHHTSGLWSRTLRLAGPCDREALLRALGGLPPQVFRAKGLVSFTDAPGVHTLQYVCGRYEIAPFPRPDVPERFVTIIGKGPADPPVALLEALSPVV
ncbi:MAG: GTP-binding protein [Desulfobacterales bacterium]